MAKRVIASVLIFVMLFAAVPVTAFAENTQPQTSVDTGDVSIAGTNGFGTLLSQEISQSQTEAEAEAEDYQAGYTVTDLVIEGSTATVTYDSMEEALLVVALYTEDGMQMLTSATAVVAADATETTVEFTGEMPEYFLASAYLVDTYDLSPLCAAYDTPMYTQEMQELLASTVDDYDADRVLNLDDDNTTNFAVYADTTIVIEAVEGFNTVASIDDENATYIIEKADEQITGLNEGDVFVYPYAENEFLIVKVASIEIKGSTVTITGDDLELEEAFATVKIEGADSTEDMVVDDSTADDGVIYEGISDPTYTGALSPMADEIGVEFSKSAKFKIDKDIISKADGDIKVTVAGSVEFSIKAELSYYVSATQQYIDFRIEKSVTGAFTITGKLEHEWKLCDAALYPVPGIGIGIEPTFKMEVSGEIEFSITLTGMIGFTYDAKQGLKPLFSKPHFDPDVKAECTIFVGFDLKPQVEIAEGYLAEFEIELPIGLEFKITRAGNGGDEPSENDLSYHTCVRCLDLEVFFRVEVTVKLQFLKCKWLQIEGTLIKERDGLGHAYFSFDNVELGFGLCPYLAHRLTVIVTDGEGNPIADADVVVLENTAKTADNGSAVFYLNAGNYPLKASFENLNSNQRIQIDQAQKVTVKLSENAENGTGIGGILGSINAEILAGNRVSFNGHDYQLFDLAMTWSDAKAYCESLGGYLATLTSQDENDFVYNYIVNCGYRDAYFGFSDSVTEGIWRWVNGETSNYTSWADGEPNDQGGYEDYAMFYSGVAPGKWNDGSGEDGNPFICEWSATDDSANASAPNAVYPGDYGTEVTDIYLLKTASFKGLVPNEQYVLLAMKSIEVTNPLASDNLLFVDQGVAQEDGTLSFRYVQRETTDISYVVACGASNKNLNDAEITFPEMTANGELHVVDPTVVYDGVTLTEGRDYVIVGTVDFTEGGTYTCYIRGIHNYAGLVECTYTVTAPFAEIASGWSGATQWTLTSDGVLTFSGEGNMKNYGWGGGQPWAQYADRITSVVIENGVTAIGNGAFKGMTTLESVTLPDSGLNRIGEAAFYGCSSLKEIYIPDGVYTIWEYTFKNCTALENVRLPKTLIKIDQGAFESCSALTELFLPTNVQIIGGWSFKACTGLKSVDMQWADATAIRPGAFKNCTALTRIILPADIQILGDSCFYGIGATSFVVPATVTQVQDWCFARSSVKAITFEGDAPAIGTGAFNKIALTAYYPSGNATWTADIMQNYGGTVTWTAQ